MTAMYHGCLIHSRCVYKPALPLGKSFSASRVECMTDSGRSVCSYLVISSKAREILRERQATMGFASRPSYHVRCIEPLPTVCRYLAWEFFRSDKLRVRTPDLLVSVDSDVQNHCSSAYLALQQTVGIPGYTIRRRGAVIIG